MVSKTDQKDENGRATKLKRAWRRRLAKLWRHAYIVRHQTGQFFTRHGHLVAAVIGVVLMAANVYLLPTLQTLLAARFGTEKGVQSVQSLLLGTGSALIGAAAIVTSLVLFAMQVNVERMPHGLFRRLSEDRKLLGAFAAAFVLAIGVAAMSTVVRDATLAAMVASAGWAIALILASFLYAYRRALKLINPLAQLQMLVDDTRSDLRRWARIAERSKPLLESEDGTESESPPEGPSPDATRTVFFQINQHWTVRTSKNLQHAVAFARRYAEQGDYEIAGEALTAIIAINTAYIEAKGRTFYANHWLVQHRLAHDALITASLECMRQTVDRGIRRRDEQQIEQSMRALAALVQVYLGIDYGRETAEKTHANLAAGYLGNAVQAVVGHDMTDVLMEGQRLMGQAALQFVMARSTTNAAGLSDKITVIAGTGCAKESYRPATMEGMRQLASLTIYLIRSPGHQVRYALHKVRENAAFVAELLLKAPDKPIEDIHGSTLAPYFSSGDAESLRAQLTDLVNAVSAAEPDNESAKTVIRNVEQWADGLYRTTKELLLKAVAARSHFTIHMLQWIQGVTELLLALSNASACDPRSQRELRSHARWLIATLDWIPNDEKSVTFAENFQLTEILFESALDAKGRGCEENADEIARTLLSWTFKGGRYINGWGVLERGLSGCASLALSGEADAVDALKAGIEYYLQCDHAPESEVLAHAARGLREQADTIHGPGYRVSRIDHAMARLDYRARRGLLNELADMLCPEVREDAIRTGPADE